MSQGGTVDNKRVAKNAVTLYFRMLFQMAVYLYTPRVVIDVLGLADYGIYDVVGGVVGILVFLNNSMITCTQRFITYAIGRGEREYLNRVYSVSLMIHALLALLVFVLAETVGLWYVKNCMVFPPERLEAVLQVYHCSVLAAMVLIINVPYNAAIIAYERMTAFAVITIVDVLLKLVIVLALPYIYGYDRLVVYAVLLLVESLTVRVLYGIYCHIAFRHLSFCLVKEGSLFREMLSFAGWSTFGNFALVCNTQGLNLVLNGFGGPLINAARATAFQVQTAITAFTGSFQTAVNPQITKSCAARDFQGMNQLILRASKFSFFLLLFVAVPLGLEIETLLHFWLTEVPDYAALFTRLLLGVSLVDAIANPMMVGASATGRIRTYHLAVGGTLLCALPLAWLMLKWSGRPEAVFWVQLMMVIVAQCVRMYLCRSLFRFSVHDFCVQVLWPIVRVAPLALILPWVVHVYITGTFMGMMGVGGMSILSVGVCVLLLGLTPREREFILSKIRRK